MKFALVLLAATALLTACGTPGAPMPPSLQLPQPPRDLSAARKGADVILTWSTPTATTDDQTITHSGATRICRSEPYAGGTLQLMDRCPSSAPEAPPVNSARNRYVDSLGEYIATSAPPRWASYAVESTNLRGRGAGLSNQVRVSLAPTAPAPPDVRAQVTADGIVIAWTGVAPFSASPQYQFRYRIFRRATAGQPGRPPALRLSDVHPRAAQSSSAQPAGLKTEKRNAAADFIALGDVPLRGEQEARLVDKSFAWEAEYQYKVTAITSVFDGDVLVSEIEGDDSPVLSVLAHDVFPPAVPVALEAVSSGVPDPQRRFIDLTWSPNSEPDLAGYNVYRRQGAEPEHKINQDVVKVPAFRDRGVLPGITYHYSVSAVDVRNNESARSQETGEKLAP